MDSKVQVLLNIDVNMMLRFISSSIICLLESNEQKCPCTKCKYALIFEKRKEKKKRKDKTMAIFLKQVL